MSDENKFVKVEASWPLDVDENGMEGFWITETDFIPKEVMLNAISLQDEENKILKYEHDEKKITFTGKANKKLLEGVKVSMDVKGKGDL